MNRILLPLTLLLCVAAVPFSGAMAQTLITQAPPPADWVQTKFLGIAVALPPGWTEVERRGDSIAFFGGDVAARTGPGFTLMLESDPAQMLKEGGFEDMGAVIYDNGALFQRYSVDGTPEAGITISGEFLVSSLPIVNGKFLMAGALGYNVEIGDYRSVFDTAFAALGVPAPGVGVVQTALNGAFDYVLPDGWETGSYNNEEALTLEQEGGQGKVTLMRFAVADAGRHRSGLYHPEGTLALPVLFLGRPALSYEWHAASKYYRDDRDSHEITRLYVFETCLTNGDLGAVEVTGMPDFHTNAQVMRLIDQLSFAPEGAAGPACRAVDLPDGAPLGAPVKGRPEVSGFTIWIPAYAAGEDWREETFGTASFHLPNSWTGGGGVWMSSRGEYQLSLSLTKDAPVPMAKRAEMRLPDGTRFFRFSIPDGTRAISAAPIDPNGHLVIDITGGQMDSAGLASILGTFKLPPPPLAPAPSAPQSVLNGLATVTPPQGFDLTLTDHSATLTAQDGRGFLALARGPDVLPPSGWITHIPDRQHGSFAMGNLREWSDYGWPGTTPDFKDGDRPDNGWYHLNILRECLAGGEPIAIVWGGISRFNNGESLSRARNAFTFNWPEGMIPCDPVTDAAKATPPSQPPAQSVEPVVEPPTADPAAVTVPPLERAAPAQGDWLDRLPSATLPSPATESLAGRWEASSPTGEALTSELPQQGRTAPLDTQEPTVSVPAPPVPPPVSQGGVDPDHFTPIDGDYSTYQNDRYGTVISYPSTYFRPEPAPDSGDGRRFASVDGTARFYVFAQYNALGQSQAEQIAQDKADPARANPSYERAGTGWYVLSGIIDDEIYYRRVIENSSGLIQVFEITYPVAHKADFDAVVTYMANSFGPGPDVTATEPSKTPDPAPGQNAEILNTGWWVVVGAFPTEPAARQSTDFARMQSLGARCNLMPFNDFSGKFRGFTPDYNVFVLGAYDSKERATDMLQLAQACYPDAFIKYAEYLGE
jgi:hypothetical protein